jgi:tetratricopeptide (TPR) repeat protein
VPDVLSAVASLVDKSLIQVAPAVSGEPRFVMLDSVRELALERLEASGQADQVRDDHARFFLRFAAGVHPAERGALDRSTLDRYVTESGNLGAAMRTFLDRGALDEAAGLGRALWQFWWVHHLTRPGIGWMEELLAHGPGLTPAVRADASFVLGMLTFETGEEDRALPALRTAVELYGRLDDARSASLAKIPLGLLVARGDPAEGEGLLEAAVAVLRELGDRWGLAFALLSLGGAKLFRDLPDEAVPLLEESAALARTAGTEVFLGNALVNLGLAHTARGDLDTARRVLTEALERSRAMDSRETTARALDGMAAVTVAAGEPERAARLTGAAEAIRRSIGADVFPPDRTSWAHTRSALVERLGPAESTARIDAEAHRPVRDLLVERW